MLKIIDNLCIIDYILSTASITDYKAVRAVIPLCRHNLLHTKRRTRIFLISSFKCSSFLSFSFPLSDHLQFAYLPAADKLQHAKRKRGGEGGWASSFPLLVVQRIECSA